MLAFSWSVILEREKRPEGHILVQLSRSDLHETYTRCCRVLNVKIQEREVLSLRSLLAEQNRTVWEFSKKISDNLLLHTRKLHMMNGHSLIRHQTVDCHNAWKWYKEGNIYIKPLDVG